MDFQTGSRRSAFQTVSSHEDPKTGSSRMDFQIGNSWEASPTGNRRRDSRNRSFDAGSGQVDSQQTGNKHSELQIGNGKRDTHVGENRGEDHTGDVQMHLRSGEYSEQYRTNMSPSSSRNPDNRRGSLMETNKQNFEHEKKTRWETKKDLPHVEEQGRLTWMQEYEEPVQREHSMKTHLITDYLLRPDKKVSSKGSNLEADGLRDLPNLTWGRRAEAGPAETGSTRSEDTVNTLRHLHGKRPRSSAGGQESFTRLPHRMENDLTSSFSSGNRPRNDCDL
jgi:hypothetical protein